MIDFTIFVISSQILLSLIALRITCPCIWDGFILGLIMIASEASSVALLLLCLAPQCIFLQGSQFFPNGSAKSAYKIFGKPELISKFTFNRKFAIFVQVIVTTTAVSIPDVV